MAAKQLGIPSEIADETYLHTSLVEIVGWIHYKVSVTSFSPEPLSGDIRPYTRPSARRPTVGVVVLSKAA